jgi:hypothetical protein
MILPLAQKHSTLRKQGAHYVGPCPKCGGSEATTRYVVNVSRDFVQCYSCGWNAGPVKFLRDIEGKSCPEAHRSLGLQCESPECPMWDKCSRGRGEQTKEKKSELATPEIPGQRKPAGYTPNPASTPAEIWQHKASTLVERAHQALLGNPDQLAYLAGRGLPLEAVQRYQLGYVPEDFYRDRASWGLPVELRADGKPKKLYIPQGIVIPWFVQQGARGMGQGAENSGSRGMGQGENQGQVHRIRIRKQTLRSVKDFRYYWLLGSGDDIICLNPSAPAHVIVESDLDGLLIDWLAGDVVGTVPLGSCSTHPKAAALAALEKSLRILVALDFDTPRWDDEKKVWIAPGAKACGWWQGVFARSYKRWPVPQGKDPGEAFAAGVDLRKWVVDGLPPALRLKAVQGSRFVVQGLNQEPGTTNLEPVVPRTTNHEPRTILSSDGREIIITDDPETYQRLTAEGKIVFTTPEIRMVSAATDTPEQAAYFLDLKTTFPGIRLESVLPDRVAEPKPTWQPKYVKKEQQP